MYNLFPTYNHFNRPYNVNQRLINKAIPIALKRILKNKTNIKNIFMFYLEYKYKIFNNNVFFDIECVKRQLNSAKISHNVKPWGHNYGGTIEISDWDKMKKEEIISLLIHESIHNSIKIRRNTRSSKLKMLSCEDEHNCLNLLGDNLNTFTS
tara:strand:- start:1273 stop:1728 length:456 start_codon:yes stop_codon:yes gene_type:complete